MGVAFGDPLWDGKFSKGSKLFRCSARKLVCWGGRGEGGLGKTDLDRASFVATELADQECATGFDVGLAGIELDGAGGDVVADSGLEGWELRARPWWRRRRTWWRNVTFFFFFFFEDVES